ncbi:hypothetical protein [Neobacillus kokaensis]|nr:hypothetical protein [Neobacillus kokaensis]
MPEWAHILVFRSMDEGSIDRMSGFFDVSVNGEWFHYPKERTF